MTQDISAYTDDELVEAIRDTERRITGEQNFLSQVKKELEKRQEAKRIEFVNGLTRDEKYLLMKLLHAQGTRLIELKYQV